MNAYITLQVHLLLLLLWYIHTLKTFQRNFQKLFSYDDLRLKLVENKYKWKINNYKEIFLFALSILFILFKTWFWIYKKFI